MKWTKTKPDRFDNCWWPYRVWYEYPDRGDWIYGVLSPEDKDPSAEQYADTLLRFNQIVEFSSEPIEEPK